MASISYKRINTFIFTTLKKQYLILQFPLLLLCGVDAISSYMKQLSTNAAGNSLLQEYHQGKVSLEQLQSSLITLSKSTPEKKYIKPLFIALLFIKIFLIFIVTVFTIQIALATFYNQSLRPYSLKTYLSSLVIFFLFQMAGNIFLVSGLFIRNSSSMGLKIILLIILFFAFRELWSYFFVALPAVMHEKQSPLRTLQTTYPRVRPQVFLTFLLFFLYFVAATAFLLVLFPFLTEKLLPTSFFIKNYLKMYELNALYIFMVLLMTGFYTQLKSSNF